MQLINKVNREEALKRLSAERFRRITLSFYRYVPIDDPSAFRDSLFTSWSRLGCFGRIYIAKEGINAQMSVPEHSHEAFLNQLNTLPQLREMPLKYAVEDDGKSFYKLTIKIRPKIVADGLDDKSFDPGNVGRHLEPQEFHELALRRDTLIIDMRNHYESEVGRFKNAWCPDADTFREALRLVERTFESQKDRKILLYCTGGIRCEKASAYLKHKGYQDVNQLHGGIIAYAHEVKKTGMESLFTGKNFVFDQRLGESIDGKIIARCHQCGSPCDSHTNCANDDCHLLFIQCPECAKQYAGCCSEDCRHIAALPGEEQRTYRQLRYQKYADSKIFKSRLRPRLSIEYNKEIKLLHE